MADGSSCAGDDNVCTDDQCLAGVCRHMSNTAPCDDQNLCTDDDQCAGGACTGNGSCATNSYQCYNGTDLKNPPFVSVVTDTVDQLASASVTVTRPKLICVPVDQNGQGIAAPNAYLVCYQLAAQHLSPRPAVEVSTQFQSSRLELKKPRLLCAPATLAVLP